LDEIGSYGRQIGRIGDTIEVLLKQLDRSRLSDAEKEVIAVFEGQLAQVRSIKVECWGCNPFSSELLHRGSRSASEPTRMPRLESERTVMCRRPHEIIKSCMGL